MHWYVFIVQPNGDLYYDRTRPSEASANERVKEVEDQGRCAVWYEDHLPPRWFY